METYTRIDCDILVKDQDARQAAETSALSPSQNLPPCELQMALAGRTATEANPQELQVPPKTDSQVQNEAAPFFFHSPRSLSQDPLRSQGS